MSKLLKVGEVAEMLGLSVSSVYKKAERNELQSIKIGTALRFYESDILNFIEKCRKQNEQVSVQTIDYNTIDLINY